MSTNTEWNWMQRTILLAVFLLPRPMILHCGNQPSRRHSTTLSATWPVCVRTVIIQIRRIVVVAVRNYFCHCPNWPINATCEECAANSMRTPAIEEQRNSKKELLSALFTTVRTHGTNYIITVALVSRADGTNLAMLQSLPCNYLAFFLQLDGFADTICHTRAVYCARESVVIFPKEFIGISVVAGIITSNVRICAKWLVCVRESQSIHGYKIGRNFYCST